MIKKRERILALATAVCLALTVPLVATDSRTYADTSLIKTGVVDGTKTDLYYRLTTASWVAWYSGGSWQKNADGVRARPGDKGLSASLKVELPEGAELTGVFAYDLYNFTFPDVTTGRMEAAKENYKVQDIYNSQFERYIGPTTIKNVKQSDNIVTVDYACDLTVIKGESIGYNLKSEFDFIYEREQAGIDASDRRAFLQEMMGEEIYDRYAPKPGKKLDGSMQAWMWYQPVVVEYRMPFEGTPLPIIEYYYDTTELYGGTLLAKADVREETETKEDIHTAPAIRTVGGKDYRLSGGVLLSKDKLGGFIDLWESEGIPYTSFWDVTGDRWEDRLTEQARKQMIVNGMQRSDAEKLSKDSAVEAWKNVTCLGVEGWEDIFDLTGTTQKGDLFRFDPKTGALQYGNGKYGKLIQLCLLYTNSEAEEELEPEDLFGNPSGACILPEEPERTNITKMYYDDPEGDTPDRTDNGGSISREDTYTVEKNDGEYELSEWVITKDDIPGEPEGYRTWSEVKENISPSGKTGNTPGELGPSNWSNPDRELFIRYNKKAPKTEEREGDLYLPQQRITWKKNLQDLGGNSGIPFSWSDQTASHKYTSGRKRKTCTIKISDGLYTLMTKNLAGVTNNQILANVRGYEPKDLKNQKTVTATHGSGSGTVKQDYEYVIWRGKDIPTLAAYKYPSGVPEGLMTLLNRKGKTPGGERASGAYTDSFTLRIGKTEEEGSDYVNLFSHDKCGDETETRYADTSKTAIYSPNVKVDVYYGTANSGTAKATDRSDQTFTNAFGTAYGNVKGYAVNNKTDITFWPYVKMIWDTMTEKDREALVLSGHRSTLKPNDYVEIGYKTAGAGGGNSTGLLLQSKQWSVHALAVEAHGKDTVLPGGAIYRMIVAGADGSGSKATKVGLRTWMTIIPEDTLNAVEGGATSYSGTAQNARSEGLYKQALDGLNSLDIVQKVNGETVRQNRGGTQKIPETASMTGGGTSTDPKYWLKQGTKETGTTANGNPSEADLDILDTASKKTFYRIYSDTEGNVIVRKGSSQASTKAGGSGGKEVGRISKGGAVNGLLSKGELKALDDRTKLISNYISAIDRNKGERGWYNEAFDGICVVCTDYEITLGIKDNGGRKNGVKTAALDPKLTPPRESQSGLYTRFGKSWFETNTHTNLSGKDGYLGKITPLGGGKEIEVIMKNMNGIYRTKDFYIPNATVMDLY